MTTNLKAARDAARHNVMETVRDLLDDADVEKALDTLLHLQTQLALAQAANALETAIVKNGSWRSEGAKDALAFLRRLSENAE